MYGDVIITSCTSSRSESAMASLGDLLCLEQSFGSDDDMEVLEATLRSLERRPRCSAGECGATAASARFYHSQVNASSCKAAVAGASIHQAGTELNPICRRPVCCQTLNGDRDSRVLANLLAFDVKCRNSDDVTSVDYFTSGLQPDIEPYMRDVITGWMLEVNNNNNIVSLTVYSASKKSYSTTLHSY